MKIGLIGQYSTTVEAVRALQQAGHTVEVFAPQSASAAFSKFGINNLVANVRYFDSIQSEETLNLFKHHAPEAILSVVFGGKIPQEIVDLAPAGAYNFHPAKLPEFRSGNAWFWPIRMGAETSALTIHRLSQQWDSGNVVWEKEFPLGGCDTQGIYVERVNALVPEFIREWSYVLETRNFPEKVQDESLAVYYPKIKFRDIMIDWTETSASISNLVKACNPYHFAQTILKGSVFEVVEASVTDVPSKEAALIRVENDRLYVGTADFDIEIKVVKFFEFGTFSAKRVLNLYVLSSGDRAKNLASDPAVADILDEVIQ